VTNKIQRQIYKYQTEIFAFGFDNFILHNYYPRKEAC